MTKPKGAFGKCRHRAIEPWERDGFQSQAHYDLRMLGLEKCQEIQADKKHPKRGRAARALSFYRKLLAEREAKE